MKKIPLVAICGRANVGKSTLFNRLVGERKSIISEIPGTTRDRVYGEIIWQGRNFNLIDTGGLIFDKKEEYEEDIVAQVFEAIINCDLILFLVDIKQGLLSADQKVLKELRKTNKKVILVANKADNEQLRQAAENLASLGLGEPIPVSSAHGTGTGDLLDIIAKEAKDVKVEENKETLTKIAIIGRPNVGKSSLFNKIIKEKRSIISEIPGTTRDVIDTEAKIGEKVYLFLDTAGLRRRTKIRKGIEYFSVLRAMRAIEDADIILFLIDASEGIARQDLHIISYVLEKGKSIILIVNKWDMMEVKDPKTKIRNVTIPAYLSYLQKKLPFLSWVPVVFISAKTGKNIHKIQELLEKVKTERQKRIRIKDLNYLMSGAILKKQPPRGKKGQMKIFYTTQAKGVPPNFIIFVKHKEALKRSYQNYLENQIREKYGFEGTPIKITLKNKK